MKYLQVTDLLCIYEAMMASFGGMRGITEAGFGRLESAAAVPQHSAFGELIFPDAPSQAAALCVAIIHAHPFSDGNKRMALIALDLTLTLNGLTLTADNDAMYDVIMAVAQRRLDRDGLIDWVHEHLAPQQDPS